MALIVGGTAVDATAAELNKLDGCAADATELGYCDGVTSAIQTQLDNKSNSVGASASGDETGSSGDYSYARFTSSGTFVVTGGTMMQAEVLIVGSGGAAGYQLSGGGGGGAVLYKNDLDIPVGSYTITVGTTHTGIGADEQADSSVFDDGGSLEAIATGGGRGGHMTADGQDGANGGGGGYDEGGKGEGTAPSTTQSGETWTVYAGNNGGSSPAASGWKPASGGGGANQVGTSPGTSEAGHGGNGIQISLNDGTNYFWGGGGGPTDTGGRGNGGSGRVIIAWTTP